MDAPKPLELVYRNVDGLDLFLDIFVPENATEAAKVPVLVWWHGSPLSLTQALAEHMQAVVYCRERARVRCPDKNAGLAVV
jgi:hypothetical protein